MRSPRLPTQARTTALVSARVRNLERRSPVGPRIYVGTVGVDGVDDQLAANPFGFRPGDTPGPVPFQNGWTNAFLLDFDGNPGDGLWFRWVGHGVQVVFGGGITGGTDGSVFATLDGVPLPDAVQPGIDGFPDGSGAFKWQLLRTGDLVYLGAL